MAGGDIRARYVQLIDVALYTPEGVQLRVVDVTKPQFSGEFQSFSVYLRGPLDEPLAQGMFELQLPDRTLDPLFLVPIGQDSHGVMYEVAFNVRASAPNALTSPSGP